LHLYKGHRFLHEHILDSRTHQKVLNCYQYLPLSSAHPPHAKAAWIRAELLRHVRNCSDLDQYLELRRLFFLRLRARGYPPKLLCGIFRTVNYQSMRPGLLLGPSAAATAAAQQPHRDVATLVLQYSPITYSGRAKLLDALPRVAPTLSSLYSMRIAWTVPKHLGSYIMRMEFPNPNPSTGQVLAPNSN
jgi:hypothetical protein